VRAKIVREATRLFAEKGVDATSVQEVASAVGLSKPSVLYHFPSKEALHAAVIDELTSRWNEVLPRLFAAATRTDRFDALFTEASSFFAEEMDRARLLVREALDRPARLRETLRERGSGWMTLLSQAIRVAQNEGLVRKSVDPEAYVLEAIILLLGTFAVGSMLQVLLPSEETKRIDPRLLTELKRILRIAVLAAPKTQQ